MRAHVHPAWEHGGYAVTFTQETGSGDLLVFRPGEHGGWQPHVVPRDAAQHAPSFIIQDDMAEALYEALGRVLRPAAPADAALADALTVERMRVDTILERLADAALDPDRVGNALHAFPPHLLHPMYRVDPPATPA